LQALLFPPAEKYPRLLLIDFRTSFPKKTIQQKIDVNIDVIHQ